MTRIQARSVKGRIFAVSLFQIEGEGEHQRKLLLRRFSVLAENPNDAFKRARRRARSEWRHRITHAEMTTKTGAQFFWNKE